MRLLLLMFDIKKIRSDFPILETKVHGKPLIYTDNAASTQKPQQVIDSISDLYSKHYANIHRGVHHLSQKSTALYEGARETVKSFINASKIEEIVFVRGTTEGVNLVASSYLEPLLQPGDEILISEMEHHSNIIPWQLTAERTGALLKIIPLLENGELDLGLLPDLLSSKVKIVAVSHMSNSLGTLNDVTRIIEQAHALGIPVLLDGAQSIAHMAIDVQELDCDFFVFSGHKIYGPTGIGVLYAKENLLLNMKPYQGGGDMILNVSFEKTEYNDIPYKFEAGTPNIEGSIGMAAALDYISELGIENIDEYEQELLAYATQQFSAIEGLRIIGSAPHKGSIISFVLDGVHPHDVGTIMDMEGIAVRTGHHCTQPVMDYYNIPATTRVSLSFYNTIEEIDEITRAITKVKELMG
ncbi:MAG: cysteine desulfurase [Candidatus Marinimicrobia bacterium]|nr:cysteine desulfurase [Candidatus Neomarinimicrobiota bacterium]MBT3632434.1 cysteine desulfurase [Candidatus Neomarinimicrobiota bacterium]MBT3825286.1 cysteine desulfurase [Candidatus Neomarinimicrobiota bacterium]MBT4130719.1 cysteine desulfurase [Candidatus Neomarinimicrobiota bacterium]MBT4295443.1 cysteine desulfurase [Candidatus Neomarinimicrobiota bacterium]